MVLESRRPSIMAIQPLPSVRKLERIIKQLSILRDGWPRISSVACQFALVSVAKDVVDLAHELRTGATPAPSFTRNEKRLLFLTLGALAAASFFLAGVHYERHNSFAPNVARVGQ
jgi:hypothetical protein